MKDPKPELATEVSSIHPVVTQPEPDGEGWRRLPLRSPAGEESRARTPEPVPTSYAQQRREPRTEIRLRAKTASVDPIRDPTTGEIHYESHEEELILNLSRRGIGLRCEQPPTVGSRLLLEIQLSDGSEPIELIGRARWTQVEVERGERVGVARVGIEVLGGSHTALERYESALAGLLASQKPLLATEEGLR